MFDKDQVGSRRGFMATLAYGVGAVGLGAVALTGRGRARAAEGNFPVRLTQAEWKKKLTPSQYSILQVRQRHGLAELLRADQGRRRREPRFHARLRAD